MENQPIKMAKKKQLISDEESEKLWNIAKSVAQKFPPTSSSSYEDYASAAYLEMLTCYIRRKEENKPINKRILKLRATGFLYHHDGRPSQAILATDMDTDDYQFDDRPAQNNHTPYQSEILQIIHNILKNDGLWLVGHKFGLFGFQKLTIDQVAKKYNIPYQNAEFTTSLAMKKLKREIESRGITSPFLEE